MNPHNLKKVELQILLTGYCKHRMPYVQHPKCFEKEIGNDPRIGIFDIETALGFNADTGFMLCYQLKEYHVNKFYTGVITKEDIDSFKFDKNVCKQLIKDMKHFDILIGYYTTKFDFPYSRTRCLKHGLAYPSYGYIKNVDVYYIVKFKLKLDHNTLDSACRLFGIKGKNHIDFAIWQKAMYGHKESLTYVVDHCKKDVAILEKLYDKVIDYSRKNNRSI
jgi:DNA polymerase elongation subunit (family B)